MTQSGQLLQVPNDFVMVTLWQDFIETIDEEAQPSPACYDSCLNVVMQLVHRPMCISSSSVPALENFWDDVKLGLKHMVQ
jgi:hypothetical protein